MVTTTSPIHSVIVFSIALTCSGKRVRELRLERGWSQDRFAHECGLDRTYTGCIERGEWNLALRNIERIANALGVTISQLMAGL